MSFFGKSFKKIRMENTEEFMELLKVPEKTRMLVRNMDIISTFKKNDDGTIQYIILKDGVEMFSQKTALGVDADFKTPDGLDAKIHSELKGDTLESVISFPDGRKMHMHRKFEGNTMQQIVWRDGHDLKSISYYEAI